MAATRRAKSNGDEGMSERRRKKKSERKQKYDIKIFAGDENQSKL